MKRVLIILIVLTLFVAPSLAEGMDLSSMTLDELTVLGDSIDAEITSRIGYSEPELSEGIYVVGKSIKSGSYKITIIKTKYEWGSGVRVYENEEKFSDPGRAIYYNESLELGDSYAVELSDGMVLEISQGTAVIAPLMIN